MSIVLRSHLLIINIIRWLVGIIIIVLDGLYVLGSVNANPYVLGCCCLLRRGILIGLKLLARRASGLGRLWKLSLCIGMRWRRRCCLMSRLNVLGPVQLRCSNALMFWHHPCLKVPIFSTVSFVSKAPAYDGNQTLWEVCAR